MTISKLSLLGAALAVAALPLTACQAHTTAMPSGFQDAGAPFGKLRLVDEVDCSQTAGPDSFSEAPLGVSKVETILGKPCRVLPNTGDAKYVAFRIGRGKHLKAGAAYVLSVEYPEDRARSLFIVNRGAETVTGFRTGAALGDVLYTFSNNNSESLKIPLAQQYRTWKTLFYLHDRMYELGLKSEDAGNEGVPRIGRPEDGFWVAIAQSRADNDPISSGAAVARIRLFEVPDPVRFNLPLHPPPAGLPRRHLFFREEMADGVIRADVPEERGVTKRTDWYEYKARLMEFLGMDTFTKCLLEFGHNQGWDSGPTNDWYNASHYPELWSDILTVMARHHFPVLPYYEYAGSVGQKGLGQQKRAMPLSGAKDYTHVSWTEINNVDITDPDTLTDAKRLLNATIVRYKSRVQFLGAWFRPRPSQMPIGFADTTLQRFAHDANQGQPVTREQLRSDNALRDRYYHWWFGKRRDFLVALRDYLRSNGIAGADILLTTDASEPGRAILGQHAVVTDDVPAWTKILQPPAHTNIHAIDYDDVVRADKHLEALTSPTPTWGQWEWQHADPQADPQDYKSTEGVLLTYSFNRAYTVSSAKAFDAFRTPAGIAAIRHYSLNEKAMEKSLGYIASDVDYAGPYSMLGEARTMAYGDPRYIGYLAANSFNRGFPEYARAFNAAFLSLPALPSVVLPHASSNPNVVVRAIRTKANGTYLSIVNVGLHDANTTIQVPARDRISDAATGAKLSAPNGVLKLSMYPCELRAIRVER